MGLKLVTPPKSEPLTLQEVKEYLRVDGMDLDETIYGLIIAAREYCETFQNRVFVTQTWELSLDDFPHMPLKLPNAPLQSVSSITITSVDGAVTNFTDFVVDETSVPGRIVLKNGTSWPNVQLKEVNGVKIQFVAGYQEVPETVKQAMKIFIAHRFENPDSEDIPMAVQLLLWGDRVL